MAPSSLKRRHGFGAALAVLGCSTAILASTGDDAPAKAVAPTGSVTSRRAVEPVAPALSAEIVTAMQEGAYAKAVAAIGRLSATVKSADERSYLALIEGIAHRLDGKRDLARSVWQTALTTNPGGRWSSKIRFEIAALEMASGRFAPAEEIARNETANLLAGGRKDRLADVYYAYARRLLHPDDAITRPDPNNAYALLVQGRSLAKGEDLRAKLLFEMARAAQAGGKLPNAIRDFLAYLKEYPAGEDRARASYHLGEALMAGRLELQARITWTDLASELARAPGSARPEAQEIRANSLYQIAKTYGIPSPPDDTQMNLGVAALRRFLAAAPTHPLAGRAAFEIAQSYKARGRSEQAIENYLAFLKSDSFKPLTEEGKRELANLVMSATFEVASILQGQRKFDEAIRAFQGYLAKFPNGPQSADAQRAILDTQLARAVEKLNRKEFADARTEWSNFVALNPLDARVPEILFQIGESYVLENQKHDGAIAAWEPLLSKFPGTEPAAHAQFLIAAIFENQKGNPAEAIDRFRKVNVDPWRTQAVQRIAVMESKALTVVTPRAFRSGETAHLKIFTRNLESLTFTAYKLNTESYFRKKHALGNVESLDVSLVAPDSEWTVPVKEYGKYKPIETTYDLKLNIPGVYVVKVTDNKSLQATTLVLGSDIDAIVKSSKDQILVFAQDMKTGKGRPNARVLISDGSSIVMEKKTGPDGVLLTSWETPRPPGSTFHYLVLDGNDSAGSGLDLPGNVAQGLSARAYLYTDRPAYRPSSQVAIRGVVREVVNGQYASPADQVYRLEVYDARGRLIVARGATLSKFGTFQDSISLDASAPAGAYRVRLFQPGKSEFAGGFEVQPYQLEKMDLSFELPQKVYFRGETIRGQVIAKYQYGAPVANRAIQVNLPDGRTLAGQSDAEGRFKFELSTEGFAEERTLRLGARLPQDNVLASVDLILAMRAFRIDLATTRPVYLDGETFQVKATTLDVQGTPTSQELKISVLKRIEEFGRVSEREVSKATLTTDKDSGTGAIALKVEDPDGGSFVVRAAGVDRFGNAIVTDRDLTISGSKDATKLRILADRQSFKVGEAAKVVVHSRTRPGTAILAWEADRVLSYRIIEVATGENRVEWAVDGSQFPNFTLTVGRMDDSRLDVAAIDIKVERDLRVSLAPTRPVVGPGDEVELDVTTLDQQGRPVAAELSVALVDQSLLRLFGDRLPEIGSYFYNQTRTGAFATEATNTFRYQPQTRPVEEAVVEEASREAAMAANRVQLGQVMNAAKDQVAKEAKSGEAEDLAIQVPRGVSRSESGMGIAKPDDKSSQTNEYFARKQSNGAMFGAMPGEKDVKLYMEPDFQELNDAPAQGLGKADRARQPKEPGGSAPPTRERFVETAYWNPSVVTGTDGKARVKFRAPGALSSYRFTARGTTGADTLVGQATSTLVVKKDFFVDLKVPRILNQGDRPRFVAQVHHLKQVGKADVSLTIYAGGRQVVLPRTIEMKGDGVTEVAFEPFEVPDGESATLTLKASTGLVQDQLVVEVPIRPWGVQAVASASGSSSNGTTVFVGLPAGRGYESPEMLVVVSPTVRRMLIELALGRDAYFIPSRFDRCVFPVSQATIADRASELVAIAAVLGHLAQVKGDTPPEATRLSARASALVSELVTLQNQDGGWPWVAPIHGQQRASDPLTSTRCAYALQMAGSLGLMTDPSAAERSVVYLTAEFAKTDASDYESRAAILHALSTHKRATFELANSLNRTRQNLNDVSLAYLALTMGNLERPALANEVLDLLASRAKTEAVAPGMQVKPRKFWEGANQHWHQSVETTALVCEAFARNRPQATELAAGVEWLLAHRSGTGWQPAKAKGPALAALSTFYAKAQADEDRYRLVVTVNDAEVYRADVVGSTEGKAIAVPRKFLKLGDPNRIKFEVEGRGTFSYAVTLAGFTRDFGPDQKPEGKRTVVGDRTYLHADPELDGKTLPTGFGSVVNPRYFANKVTQVGLGGQARVQLQVHRYDPDNQPAWQRSALIVEESLPAGATLIEGSVQTSATSYEVADGTISFFFAPDQYPGQIQFDIFGYLPGQYRTLPTRVHDAYDPGKYHLGPASDLRVLSPGEPATDPYKATPDELFARGKAEFEAGRLAESAAALEELSTEYTLQTEILKQTARMLLSVHIKLNQPRKIVEDFEILKEKAPDIIIPFDEIVVVGRAYRDINEHERAYLVWRAITEASYLEDAQVGEVLRQRGKSLDAVAYLLDLWREYPNSPSIEADFFGISQILAERAGKAFTDPVFRKELADAGVTRSELLLQSIRLIQILLSQSPRNPLADEASLALVGDFLDLEDFPTVVALSNRFARLYPKSSFLDSFQYSEALGDFHLGKYDQAVELAEKISKATYQDANKVDQPSPNKWQAIYILGQIFDARRQPGRAVGYYQQVADRFTDAAGAVRSLTRKDLKLPEVSLVQLEKTATAPKVGLNSMPPEPAHRPEVKLDYRNISEVDVKVYPVDLMRLYLSRRNLDAIAGIDLAGITPLYESTIKLGDGQDFADKLRTIDLPINKEGAYLVMTRGGDLYASGVLLVSGIELEVLEEADSGRVRVSVRDAKTKAALPKVQVKFIGSENPTFFSGETDLRGVFVAEGIRGHVTVVARKETNQYAFYRGTTRLGTAPPAVAQPGRRGGMPGAQPEQWDDSQALDANLKNMNRFNQMRQIQRLEDRNRDGSKGVKSSDAY